MKRVAVYTLTRDRLAYTQHCFATLASKAGVPYDHYVVDNGSEDGTVEWLQNTYRPKKVIRFHYNAGISRASNVALTHVFMTRYDLIVKFDNDCEVVSDNILGQIVEIYEDGKVFAPQYILSPAVGGIANQPKRVRYTMLAGRRIGLTSIVGGLFHVVPLAVYRRYHYPENLPLARGQDDHFCHWARANGCEVGYIEGLQVNHYRTTDGQAQDYPEYFERKWREEKKPCT